MYPIYIFSSHKNITIHGLLTAHLAIRCRSYNIQALLCLCKLRNNKTLAQHFGGEGKNVCEGRKHVC